MPMRSTLILNRLIVAALFGLASLPAAQAATPAAVSLKDPAVFVQQLREMGYAPEPIEGSSSPTFVINSAAGKLVITMGGCTANRDCSYVVLLSSFHDVKRPPADWVAARNAEFDLIKVWVNDEGLLTYSAGFFAEGMDRGLFRSWIDSTEASGTDLAQQAIKAGIVKP